MNVREIHSFREVLSEQTVRVFVGAALPRTLWIAEVDLDVSVQAEACVISHLFATIPGQRLVKFTRYLMRLLDQGVDHCLGILALDPDQRHIATVTLNQGRNLRV